MIQFTIKKPEAIIQSDLIQKINNLTKPKKSLGLLEELAVQIGLIQQTLTPKLSFPNHIIFAADHGISVEHVSVSPVELTWQMVKNFCKGGTGINFLVNQHHFKLNIVDAGVDYDFSASLPIINRKIAKGTRNFLYGPAMSHDEMNLAVLYGAESVQNCFDAGCNIISFGEMGISNTSSSALWMSLLTETDLRNCVGAGSDNTANIVSHKYQILKQAKENYSGDCSVESYLAYFGGFEMVMTVGAMLKAAELGMIILIDGFIMTNCILAASKLYPEVLAYAVFCHLGDETGHKLLLDYLNAKPILSLGLRLGEGTGAICAYPIVDSAVRMINEMGSFEDNNVKRYFQ